MRGPVPGRRRWNDDSPGTSPSEVPGEPWFGQGRAPRLFTQPIDSYVMVREGALRSPDS